MPATKACHGEEGAQAEQNPASNVVHRPPPARKEEISENRYGVGFPSIGTGGSVTANVATEDNYTIRGPEDNATLVGPKDCKKSRGEGNTWPQTLLPLVCYFLQDTKGWVGEFVLRSGTRFLLFLEPAAQR